MTDKLSHLPISARVRLDQLKRLKELREADGLTEAQQVMADHILSSASINIFRRQVIEEMVASGYIDEEIKLAFADPDSPYSILIEGLKSDNLNSIFQQAIRNVKQSRRKLGQNQFRKEFIQQQYRLMDATWEALASAGASHHKSLLEFANDRSEAIAEAQGVRFMRGGRATTKQGQEEEPEDSQPTDEPDAVTDTDKPDWEEEFVADDSEEGEESK